MPIDSGFFYRGGKEFPMVFINYWLEFLEGEVKLSWKHTEYKWISLDEALDEPTLDHFHQEFRRILKLKEYLPNEFIL